MSLLVFGVLVHGCHLQARSWEEIVWGIPSQGLQNSTSQKDQDKPGRIPQAIAAALELAGGLEGLERGAGSAPSEENTVPIETEGKTSLGRVQESSKCVGVVFGTGASVDPDTGKLEAEKTADTLWAKFSQLKEFTSLFSTEKNYPEEWWDRLRAALEKLVVVETGSQNTRQEVANGARILEERGATSLVLVSSQTHISRCLRDAIIELEERASPLRHSVYATPTSTSYADSDPSQVVIFEPPHRADRDNLPLHLLAKRLLAVPAERKAEMMGDLEALLQKYGV
jgi:DUF218 domain